MKKTGIILTLIPAAVFTGCSFGASIDTLMAPPKLSQEQEQIYNALTISEGAAISLKYPKSGKYLSAFIIEDIDGDKGNEAVVFYERNSISMDENQLRINILDKKENGEWTSVYDTAAEGPEIEKVMISQLGDNDRINLIIGCGSINRSEKNVSMYTYSEGMLVRTFAESYSYMDVTDLDGDNKNEFLLLQGSSNSDPAVATAYQLNQEGKYYPCTCDLSGAFTEFDSLGYGRLPNGKKGLYIDALSDNGSIQTDILYMEENKLKKIFSSPEESLNTKRPSGCSSFDIDNDGVLEIPKQIIAPGYNESPESEQMKLTNWTFIGNKGRLERKYTSYYSIGDGYIFVFPEKWRDKVTVRRDAINDEIVFCTCGDEERELMRIFCAEDSASREDHISMGYMLLHTKGESAYLAYIPQSDRNDDGLSINEGDAAVGFRFRD